MVKYAPTFKIKKNAITSLCLPSSANNDISLLQLIMEILGLIFHFYQKHFTSPILSSNWASQMVLVVKNPPANAGVVRDAGLTLGSGRSPGEGTGTHSSILAWRISWTEESGGLSSVGSKESDMTEAT